MSSDNIYTEKRHLSSFCHIWHLFYQDTSAMVGFYGFITLLILCLFGSDMTPYEINQKFLGYQLLPPSWSRYGDISFFLGTDDLGRDVLSRLLSGTALTVGSAILVTLLSILCAMGLGLLIGVSNSLWSVIIKHVLDVLLSLPSLLLVIVVISFIGPNMNHTLLAIWLALLPRLVNSISTAIHEELEKDYSIAARLDGANNSNILWYVILPNILPLLVSEFTRTLSIAILDIAAMGFLNLGAQFPSPEWGAMLGDALKLIYVAPWAVMLPGIAITLSVLTINLFGDGIRRAIISGVA